MKARCLHKSNPRFFAYGGRGISFDPRWESFTAFLQDMGERPFGKTLERKDNDGDYCKNNCIWATRSEQARNTSRTIHVSYQGKTQCLLDWARELGLGSRMLYYRFTRDGIRDPELLFAPARRRLGRAIHSR